jgi:hypothetical protein
MACHVTFGCRLLVFIKYRHLRAGSRPFAAAGRVGSGRGAEGRGGEAVAWGSADEGRNVGLFRTAHVSPGHQERTVAGMQRANCGTDLLQVRRIPFK